MRIDSTANLTKEMSTKAKAGNKPNEPFASLMTESKQKLQKQALQLLLAKVDERGETLAQQRTFENLSRFKGSVRAFLNESVRGGLELADERSNNPSETMQRRQTIRIVDEKLLELQDNLIDNEKEALELMDKIGEIKGLLVNLYY